MKQLDFSEKNLKDRWLEVNNIWRLIQGETKSYIKKHLERALELELTAHLGCNSYERIEARQGYRNGSYARDLLTSYGWIEGLSVPRARGGGFKTKLLERYRRRTRAVDRVLLEAFLLGHGTRKTIRLFRRLFGAEISPQAVSNIVRELDDEVKAFHKRPLGSDYEALYLDGMWMTFRKPFHMRKVLLVALGERHDGGQELLGFQLAPSESEACWWGFLSDLKSRGLRGMEVIISDGASGLLKAIWGLYPRIAHQICIFHKAMDLGNHLIDKRHRKRIIADALHIFEASSEGEARKRLREFKNKWAKKEPRAVRNFYKDLDTCFTFMNYPEPLRRRLKTNNPIERYLEEIRRRIIPMRSFNNSQSAERIIYGIIAYVLNKEQDMPNDQFTQFA